MNRHDTELDAAEELLAELGQKLDQPVKDERYLRALLALGKRSRSLFRGFVQLYPTDATVAGFVLLRPAAEINLMLRFLVREPELHTTLWEAEGELETLKLVNELEQNTELATKTGWSGLSDEVRLEREEFIESARAEGLAADVKGVSSEEGNRVCPSMDTLAHSREYADQATREAYILAFRPLSQHIHTTSRAFDDGLFEQAAPGTITFAELAEPEQAIRRHRTLNVTIYASTLTLLSEPLGLDVLETASRTRDWFVSGGGVAGSGEDQQRADPGP